MSQPMRWEYTLKCTDSFFSPRVIFFFFLSSHTKKGGKALLHYKGLQMYNYTVRSMWSLLGYIIDTDSTSKTRKTTKFYIYIYIYIYAKVYTKYTRYIYRSKTRKRISHAKWSVCWLSWGHVWICLWFCDVGQIKYFHLIVVNIFSGAEEDGKTRIVCASSKKWNDLSSSEKKNKKIIIIR